jgi:hypothetical protein
MLRELMRVPSLTLDPRKRPNSTLERGPTRPRNRESGSHQPEIPIPTCTQPEPNLHTTRAQPEPVSSPTRTQLEPNLSPTRAQPVPNPTPTPNSPPDPTSHPPRTPPPPTSDTRRDSPLTQPASDMRNTARPAAVRLDEPSDADAICVARAQPPHTRTRTSRHRETPATDPPRRPHRRHTRRASRKRPNRAGDRST